MITKFKIFEMITPEDYKKNLDLNMEQDAAKNQAASDQDVTRLNNLKITDIQNRIQFLSKQKEDINNQIINYKDVKKNVFSYRIFPF